jgi:hypothetical protein
MRQPYVHEAVLTMAPEADTRAPGGAITVALCGHWEHPPPCPLAAHHTAVERDGAGVRVRTVFAADAGTEGEVRARIDRALADGALTGPDGALTRWDLVSSAAGSIRPDETALADRLVNG